MRKLCRRLSRALRSLLPTATIWNLSAFRRSLLVVSLLISSYLLYRDYHKTSAGLAHQADNGELMIAAYRFSEEKYHAQLEFWEALCEPNAKRLEAFETHKIAMARAFQSFFALLERARHDVDPESQSIAREIGAYYAQIISSWEKTLAASGEARHAAQLASEELLDHFGLNEKVARIIELQTRHTERLHQTLQAAAWRRLIFNESLIAGISLFLSAGIFLAVRREKRLLLRLSQAEKLSALGQLSAGVAHELNNPLTIIRGFNNRVRSALQRSRAVTPDLLDYLGEVDEGADRMSKIIDHLRSFSRKQEKRPVPFSINTAIRRAFDFFDEQVRLRGIEVGLYLCPENPEIDGFPNRFEQAVINLITNARDAMGGWDQRTPTIQVSTAVEDEEVVFRFADNGPGIPKKIIHRVFEPFFTTKPTGAGTGLGLSIVNEIVEEHAGEVAVESPPGQGTVFTIRVPLARPASGMWNVTKGSSL